MTDDTRTKGRRNFLKLAGAAAPAAALAAAGGEPAGATEADRGSDRIQDTAHTRAYLASARF